jgi:lipoprotein-anchoring transpeptidase ErfK/SrfK
MIRAMRARIRIAAALAGAFVALAGSTAASTADTSAPVPACVPSDTTTCPPASPAPACVPSATTTCPPASPAPACIPSDAAPCPAAAPAPDLILSNETTYTTWATPLDVTAVRLAPSLDSPRVAMLHFSTEDGFPEVYIVLRQRQVGTRAWAQVRLPMKQAGRTGWVPRAALDSFNRVPTELVLNRATQRIRLYRSGRLVLDVPAGIGAPATPTPAGHFWIREGFRVSSDAAYGPYAFGTSAYSNLTDWPGGGVVGLHGTNQPQLVPGRPSHGCIRVRNADILRLARLVSVGTPLLVQ